RRGRVAHRGGLGSRRLGGPAGALAKADARRERERAQRSQRGEGAESQRVSTCRGCAARAQRGSTDDRFDEVESGRVGAGSANRWGRSPQPRSIEGGECRASHAAGTAIKYEGEHQQVAAEAEATHGRTQPANLAGADN